MNGFKKVITGPSSANIKFNTYSSVSCGFKFCLLACAMAASKGAHKLSYGEK